MGVMFIFSAEFDFLIDLIKKNSDMFSDSLKSNDIDIDWKLFSLLTKKHRVETLVYENLIKHTEVEVDEQFLSGLRITAEKKTLESLKTTAELVKVMKLFKDNDIRAISVKGPALAYEIYGSISLRTSHDIDIFVNPVQFEKAIKLLISTGYKSLENFDTIDETMKKLILSNNHHLSFKSPSGVLIELHHRLHSKEVLSKDFSLDFDGLWENHREYSLQGNAVNVLGFDDNFLFLVYHGSKHAWFRLKWIVDIYYIVLEKEMDWNSIIHKFDKKGSLHMLGQTLLLLDTLFGYQIPEELKDISENSTLAKKLHDIALEIIEETDENQFETGKGYYFLFKKYKLLLTRGLIYKIKHIAHVVKPKPVDFESLRLPQKLYFLYYFYRPFHKVARIIRKKANH